MRGFFKRLFCLHLNWREGRPLSRPRHPDDYINVWGKGKIIPWTCTNCGKAKQFTESNPPIQYRG